ncbi:rab3 GTPase-activating protein catalytic subunit [Diorhabda sublineata]|uniref:rab3 GTPase-activating protein catalytic subunit n=1 Tax=Diorhabda sublineata TaxID=1163346 RepID=UPI0024E0AAA4|nr:rab3 GTPase-activating protein catalytic subunit [Diorhabda sublineata]
MNEEIDDSEFYHQDFTTASEWEVFMARMEEIINQWKLDDTRNESATDRCSIWNIKSEKLQFADAEFVLYLYSKQIENSDTSDINDNSDKPKNPLDTSYDFELYSESNNEEHSILFTWYGLNEYLVLSPTNSAGITSESKIKILLSSAYIVSSNLLSSANVSCQRPIFIQIREKWQKCYLGVFENEIMRTNFEMVHLKAGPSCYYYLHGILDLFTSKIMSPCNIDDISISSRNTYLLSDFGNYVWKQDLLNESYESDTLCILPFGVTVDPVNAIVLNTTWNHLSQIVIIDRENHSSFSPMNAMQWSVLIKTTAEPVCLLADAVAEFFQNFNNQNTMYEVLGDFASLPSADTNPLDLLTEPAVPSISRLLTRAGRPALSRSRKGANPPLTESILVPLLYFLFPDADEKTASPYGKEDKESSDVDCSQVFFKKIDEEFKGYKTCNVDSLPWRLSIVLAHCLQSLGGLKAFAHIWYEFVQEMRYRWEKSLPIPGLSPGLDVRTCLLHQKLQMLNHCIERKITRENAQQPMYESAEDSSTDDEFYDCSSEKPPEEKSKEKQSLWNQPVGRLCKCGNLKLLKTGNTLYIPVTQEQALKTEDQVQEHSDFLLNLGSNAEATEIRARLMSASLLSDMESFKAANPGAVVEDFIRWYSPADWIEEDELDQWGQKVGHLSSRMLIAENNIWMETWESAKPVPAHRQKRLFDDTREAEKVLQFLDLRSIAQICELIIPILTHAAIYRLIEECQTFAQDHQELSSKITKLIRIGEHLTREQKVQLRRFESFIHEITSLELLVSQMNSLHYKLNPSRAVNERINDIVVHLVSGDEVVLEDMSESEVGSRIVSMFAEAQKAIPGDDKEVNKMSFPSPAVREFVLRANAVKPAVHSAKCPQFLRAVLSKDEFRLCGAFSEDTVFF